jgi:hypothetical protein
MDFDPPCIQGRDCFCRDPRSPLDHYDNSSKTVTRLDSEKHNFTGPGFSDVPTLDHNHTQTSSNSIEDESDETRPFQNESRPQNTFPKLPTSPEDKINPKLASFPPVHYDTDANHIWNFFGGLVGGLIGGAILVA